MCNDLVYESLNRLFSLPFCKQSSNVQASCNPLVSRAPAAIGYKAAHVSADVPCPWLQGVSIGS